MLYILSALVVFTIIVAVIVLTYRNSSRDSSPKTDFEEIAEEEIRHLRHRSTQILLTKSKPKSDDIDNAD
ncbi:hypothetical protein ACFL54_04095 [Planctomycetota bacterium]